MGPQVWYGSLPTFSDWTLSRVLDNEYRTDSALYKQVQAYIGRVAFTGIEQPLDINGNSFGAPSTAVGVLRTIDPGSYDSESEAARMWQLVAAITNIT